MFSSKMYLLFSVILIISLPVICISELLPGASSLYLWSPGALEYTDVIVKRVGDNLTLECETRGEPPALYVWNFVAANSSVDESQPYTTEQNSSSSSRLLKWNLSTADSGRYVCTAPPFSATKYILVQPYESKCALGALSCGARCVLALYVCDGRPDCVHGEDEAASLCGERPCARSDRLNCSGGRCIPEAACCRSSNKLCSHHACCEQQPRYNMQGFDDLEMPPQFEDRRAPDDYGFIQSTIYTVTACALIFMIAVVLLVSAICKMHMKRAALRSYAHADRQTRTHYNMHYAQRHRFPPCYESSTLLEHASSPVPSPTHQAQCDDITSPNPSCEGRLASLTSVFTSRYRQVPTQCTEVEMSPIQSWEAHVSTAGDNPQSPHRVTLQLGRFHLSLPRLSRRPDTPTVPELPLPELEARCGDTYTLNGRTIRLLGAEFDTALNGQTNPPPYNEAMRYKLYGPPPEYLSRERLNRANSVDEEARNNVEMPPGYEELSGDNNGGNNGNNAENNGLNGRNNGLNAGNNGLNAGNNAENNGPNAGNNGVNNAGNNNGNDNGDVANGSVSEEACGLSSNTSSIFNNVLSRVSSILNGNNDNGSNNNGNENTVTNNDNNITSRDNSRNDNASSIVMNNDITEDNGNVIETLNSVIDNLPAIDSDVNANDDLGVA